MKTREERRLANLEAHKRWGKTEKARLLRNRNSKNWRSKNKVRVAEIGHNCYEKHKERDKQVPGYKEKCSARSRLRYENPQVQQWHADYALEKNYGPGAGKHKIKQLTKQKGLCALCKKKMAKIHFDHNHETGAWRELLCSGCNTGLARVENKIWLKKALAYLKRHS